MTQLEFWGCAFISFGLPLAMFIFTVAKDPLRIIVFVARCVWHGFVLYSFPLFIIFVARCVLLCTVHLSVAYFVIPKNVVTCNLAL